VKVKHLYMALLVVVCEERIACGGCAEYNSPCVNVAYTGLNKRRGDESFCFGGNGNLHREYKFMR
jgi:hypothetical protein